MEVKEKIITCLRSTNRVGIDNLLFWMEQNGFYDAPCSSRYHLAKRGGLAEHSLNVFKNAISIIEPLYVKEGKELKPSFIDSVAICSLLHDLGKTGQFGKRNYIERNEDHPEYNFKPFEYNKDLLYVPHEVRSIAIASQFIDLSEEEQFAILYHNGLYGELKSIRGNETELYMILHFADMWASRVTEKEEAQ